MTDTDYTAIALCVDRSGSMASIAQESNQAIASFIEDQRSQPGRATLRASTFDSYYEEVFTSVDINAAPAVTILPRGLTAMYDGVGTLVTSLGEELAALPEDERPSNVIVVIVTDGAENSSRDWNASSVKKIIERQQNDYDWNFVFLGANQDAVTTASSMGIGAGTALTYAASGAGATQSYAATSGLVSAMRGGTRGASFSDADRKAAAK